jgi:hypothetical protein
MSVAAQLPENNRLSNPVLPWELHEACAAWPEMSPADLRDLANDIAANGLRDPVTLTPDNLLLDGRNRALGCIMAGVDPAVTAIVHDGDPWLYSISRNKHRRHLTTDQIAMVAAKLATRTVGNPKLTIGSSEPIGIAQAAAAAGVPETAIKSAKVVRNHGTPEEIRAVESGNKRLRPTADDVRKRRRALAPPAPPKPSVKAQPTVDPIEALALDIVSKCSDGKWRAAPKIASIAKAADSAIWEALKRLEGCVEQRKNGNVIEYRIEANGEALLRRSLAAKDEEIASLKHRIAAQDAEIERLKKLLDAPSVRTPPTRKQQRRGVDDEFKPAEAATSTAN